MLKFTGKHTTYQGLPSTQSSALHLLWSQIPNMLLKDQAHVKRNRPNSKNLQGDYSRNKTSKFAFKYHNPFEVLYVFTTGHKIIFL